MNKKDRRRQRRLARHKQRSKEILKKRNNETHPNAGMTPTCKAILARSRERLRGEGKRSPAQSAPGRKTDKSLRRTMAS